MGDIVIFGRRKSDAAEWSMIIKLVVLALTVTLTLGFIWIDTAVIGISLDPVMRARESPWLWYFMPVIIAPHFLFAVLYPLSISIIKNFKVKR